MIQVIVGTTRDGRFSELVSRWVLDQLSTREDLTVELLDLRGHPLPFFDGPAPAKALRQYPDKRSRRSVGDSIAPTDSSC